MLLVFTSTVLLLSGTFLHLLCYYYVITSSYLPSHRIVFSISNSAIQPTHTILTSTGKDSTVTESLHFTPLHFTSQQGTRRPSTMTILQFTPSNRIASPLSPTNQKPHISQTVSTTSTPLPSPHLHSLPSSSLPHPHPPARRSQTPPSAPHLQRRDACFTSKEAKPQ